MMKIGNVEIIGKASLAPMAGVADRAFREICRSFGAAYTVTEMVSANGLVMNDKKSFELMTSSDIDRPFAVQIFGAEPQIMAQAARKAVKTCHPDILDINMGCPAPKVTKGGGGSALMRNPALAGEIVRAVVRAVDIPVTVKLRKGWDAQSVNVVEMAGIAEENGAAAVCVHGRTREQLFAPPADLSAIAAVKAAVRIPVIGNGDVSDGPDAAAMLRETGCDLLMIGRGALGHPWVFREIDAFLSGGTVLPPLSAAERMEILLSHTALICRYRGERIGMNEARKHALWYTKGIRGAAEYRRRLSNVRTYAELAELAALIAEEAGQNSL